jgi:hypothetical protein
MAFWSFALALTAVAAIYWGITDPTPASLVGGLLLLYGAVGIWLRFAGAKWVLVILCLISCVSRLALMFMNGFGGLTVFSTILFAYLTVRFFLWTEHAVAQQR